MSQFPSPTELIERLRRERFRTRKSLGQHFLTDEAILERIADLTGADSDTLAVEIGPGPGTLTHFLKQRAGVVIAVERDQRLRRFHLELFPPGGGIEFVYGDALRIDLMRLARQKAERSESQRLVLAGNIPFQITSPLLFGQVGPDVCWNRMVLMVQRQVADRITSEPNSRVYGVLTVKLSYWWKVTDRFEVSADRFSPRPKVDATVLVFEPTGDAVRPTRSEWPGLSEFIDAGFNQRRKKFYNTPAGTLDSAGGKGKLQDAMEELGLHPDARAENLSPEDYLALFQILTGNAKT